MRKILGYIAAILMLAAVAGQAGAATTSSAHGTVNLAVGSYMSYTPNPTSVAVTITWHANPTKVYIGGTISCNVGVNIAANFTQPNGSPPTPCTWTYTLNHSTAPTGTTTYGTTSSSYLVFIDVDFDKNGVNQGSPYTFPAFTVSEHAAGTPPAGNLYITLSAS